MCVGSEILELDLWIGARLDILYRLLGRAGSDQRN